MRCDVSRVLADRFEVVAQLGAGSMGEVYRARDLIRGQDIALKVLPELDPSALTRFKNEFRALHDVRHPNLVRLHELHEDHGTWFFTMQLVEGTDVLTWVGSDEKRLRAVLPQIARALHRLHGDGLVHRDVKPSNIRVTPQGTAMLLDFGLIAPTFSPGEGVGTPAYMAPEQVDGDVTPAADWYAFGVLIFRALTQRLPFIGSAEEVMAAKLERPAPRVRDIAPSAPLDLAALADSLLARKPRERATGTAALAALGAEAEPTRFAQSIVFGRDRELAELRRAVINRMAGESFAIEVVGESGIGKTTLLRAFSEETEQTGSAWVVSGKCWERESVPYKGFDGVIDELAARLAAEDWKLPDRGWSALLVQAFPALRGAPGFADLAQYEIGGHETAARVSNALRWLLAEIAARQPLVLIIDDLQWADRDTLALLRAVLDPPLPNLLITFGAREHIPIETRSSVRSIALEPLSESDTTMLVELVVRELGGSVDASAVAREASGHPLLAAELARHVAATGELTSLSLDDIVSRVSAGLGADARRIARLLGLAHGPLSVEATAHAAGGSSAAFYDALAELRNAQLVATSGVGPEARIEPYHDRIRSALVSDIEPGERQELHRCIARGLTATGSHDHAALADHWERAGDARAAATHALRAAEQAEAVLAFHRASHLYRWVLALDPTLTRSRVRLAESLAQAGLGVDAADEFLECARTASSAEAIDLRRRAMQQLLLMGHSERAFQLLDELMRALGLPNPRRRGQLVLQLLRRRAAVRLRKLALPGLEAGEAPPLDRARVDVVWDAAAGFALLDPLRAFYFHALNFDLCFRIADRTRIARALMGEVPYLASSGKHSDRLDKLLTLADEARDRAGFPALTPLARGTTAFFFGQWRDCRTLFEQCERLLQQDRPRLVREGFGPAHLSDLVRRLHAVAILYLGDLKELHARISEFLEDALQRNDFTSATHLRSGVQTMFYLAYDQLDAAITHAAEGFRPWRDTHIGIPHFMDLQSRAAIEMYQHRGEAAYRAVLELWPKLVKARLFRAQYVHVTLLDVRARAAVAAALQARDRRAALADAERCARELHALAAVWSVPLAHATRAAVAMCNGDRAGAQLHLGEAARGFAAADMPLYEANARLVSAELGGDQAAAAVQRGVLATAGVVDIARYSRVLLPRA